MIRTFAKGRGGEEAATLKFKNVRSNIIEQDFEDIGLPVSNHSSLKNSIFLGENKFAFTQLIGNTTFQLSIFDTASKKIEIYQTTDINFSISHLKVVLRGRMLHFINGYRTNAVHKAFDLDSKAWSDLAYPPISMTYSGYIGFGLVDSSMEDELIVVAPYLDNASIVSGQFYMYKYNIKTNSWITSDKRTLSGYPYELCRLGDYIYIPSYATSGNTRTVTAARMACNQTSLNFYSYGPSISLTTYSSTFQIQGFFKLIQDNGLYFIFNYGDWENYFYQSIYYIDLTKQVITPVLHGSRGLVFQAISGDNDYLYGVDQITQKFGKIIDFKPIQEVPLPMSYECEFDKPSKHSYLSTEYDNPVNEKFIVPKGAKLLFTTNGTSGECVPINEE